jgi:hypothetical protein
MPAQYPEENRSPTNAADRAAAKIADALAEIALAGGDLEAVAALVADELAVRGGASRLPERIAEAGATLAKIVNGLDRHARMADSVRRSLPRGELTTSQYLDTPPKVLEALDPRVAKVRRFAHLSGPEGNGFDDIPTAALPLSDAQIGGAW